MPTSASPDKLAILEAIPDIITVVDQNKVYTWINQPGLDFFGPDVIGHEASFYFEGQQNTYEIVQPLFEGSKESVFLESWQKRSDGQKRLLAWWCHVLKDNHGNITGAISTARDITDQKRMGESLQQSQSVLQNVIDLLPIRIFWKDQNLNYLGCNKAFAQDAGKNAPQELIGKDDFQMGWKDQADLYREDDMKVIRSGASKLNYEEPQTTPSGNTIWLNTNKVPLLDNSGNIIGVLGTYLDITERKHAQDELKSKNEDLEKMNHAMVDREMKMVELKAKIAKLEAGLKPD